VWKESYPEEDRQLVALCRKGDPHAFEELVRKYQHTILSLAYHYIGYRNDIEDVAQKIFTKIYFSLSKFDTRRPFFPWIYRIAINQCYDELRQIRRRKSYNFSELSPEEANSLENRISQENFSQTSDEDRREMHALLYKMLDRLSAHQRLAIVLRDLEGIPYAEMAVILKCTEQAARLKVFRARGRLKTLMEEALRREKSARLS
jgi:RNA polymerase sigma-70 factor (ECF subfamily)